MRPIKRSFLKRKADEYWLLIKKDVGVGNPVQRYRKLSDEWESVKATYPEVSRFFKETLEELVKADYAKLIDIYIRYNTRFLKDINAMADKVRAKNIIDKICETFDYNSLKKSEIKGFFKKYSTELNLHVCFYCEAIPIYPYRYNKGVKSQWSLDHVLDKKDCPLLCYSLHNFVPSCTSCNTGCKGTKVLGGTRVKVGRKKVWMYDPRRMRKLSPSASGYNFDKSVTIDVLPVNTSRCDFMKEKSKYKIHFDCNDEFVDFITLFHLEERYNADDVKEVALNLLDKRRKYPPVHKALLAKLSKKQLKDFERDHFSYVQYEYLYHKMFVDIMNMKVTPL